MQGQSVMTNSKKKSNSNQIKSSKKIEGLTKPWQTDSLGLKSLHRNDFIRVLDCTFKNSDFR